MELGIKKGVCKVGLALSANVRIFLAVILWTFILLLFTIGNPGFVPVAKFIIVVIILPYAIVECLKGNHVITKYILASRFVALGVGTFIWYYLIR